MKITMIGHSTVLIETKDKKIITDPFFSSLRNPVYRRIRPAAMSREDLLDANLVLLSHNHFDHVDRRFFRALSPEVPVLVPRRMKWLSKVQGVRNCVGVSPWESREYGGITITAVPAPHLIVAIGFVIEEAGKQVYFAGDTYHGSFMKKIGMKFRLDAALIPVTTFRIPMTMGEKSAVRAAADLSAKAVIPIHLGIEPRSPLMRTGDSAQGFEMRLKASGVKSEVVILREGESWSVRAERETE